MANPYTSVETENHGRQIMHDHVPYEKAVQEAIRFTNELIRDAEVAKKRLADMQAGRVRVFHQYGQNTTHQREVHP